MAKNETAHALPEPLKARIEAILCGQGDGCNCSIKSSKATGCYTTNDYACTTNYMSKMDLIVTTHEYPDSNLSNIKSIKLASKNSDSIRLGKFLFSGFNVDDSVQYYLSDISTLEKRLYSVLWAKKSHDNVKNLTMFAEPTKKEKVDYYENLLGSGYQFMHKSVDASSDGSVNEWTMYFIPDNANGIIVETNAGKGDTYISPRVIDIYKDEIYVSGDLRGTKSILTNLNSYRLRVGLLKNQG